MYTWPIANAAHAITPCRRPAAPETNTSSRPIANSERVEQVDADAPPRTATYEAPRRGERDQHAPAIFDDRADLGEVEHQVYGGEQRDENQIEARRGSRKPSAPSPRPR